MDLACGVGYGSFILARAGVRSVGIDRDAEAIRYARKHYAHALAQFQVGEEPGGGKFDAAVCFETIEHIEDPRPLLRSLRRSASRLIASVPNEEKFPYRGYAFHFRHYTPAQFEALLAECGWRIVEWWGQVGPQSDVERNAQGRTSIVVAERGTAKTQKVAAVTKRPPAPRRVAILGLGPSVRAYQELVKRAGGRHVLFDEVWGINAIGDVHVCDVVFHMDDVRIQEIRARARPQSNIAAMLRWMKSYRGRVITSRPHPDYACLEAFPLEAVINDTRFAYFNSTAAYAVAYAAYLRVEELTVFGNDFTYPNAHDAEKGRACVEFWLGLAAARGVKLAMPQTSSLMDACYKPQGRVYGYDTLDFAMQDAGDRLVVTLTPHKRRPKADAIEAAYDHSRHPNPLVEK